MSEHPNVAILREMHKAMGSGDPEAMTQAVADDVVWHEIGSSEPVRGRAALQERWATLGDPNTEFKMELHDVMANDDHAVELVSVTIKNADGKAFSYRTAEIYHMRDGKITERWAFSDDTDAINKFFGS